MQLASTCHLQQVVCREAAPAAVREVAHHCSCPQCNTLSFSSAAILLAAAEQIAMIVIGRVLQGIAVSGISCNILQLGLQCTWFCCTRLLS